MSAPARELPKLVDYVLLPVINLSVAFLAAGAVVLAIGENPAVCPAIDDARSGRRFRWSRHDPLFHHRFHVHGTGGGGCLSRRPLQYRCRRTGDDCRARRRAGVRSPSMARRGGSCCRLRSIAAIIFGAAWAFIPAYLQAKRGSHIVITTIMFNLLASTLIVYLLVNVMGKPGSMAVETKMLSDATRLPLIRDILKPLGLNVIESQLNPSFIIAILASDWRLAADLAHAARL